MAVLRYYLSYDNDEDLARGLLILFMPFRDEMMENSVAGAFVGAQESIQSIHQVIGKSISLVFENGRVPTEEEFDSQCCGSGGCGSC